jgi:hypothetical protein
MNKKHLYWILPTVTILIIIIFSMGGDDDSIDEVAEIENSAQVTVSKIPKKIIDEAEDEVEDSALDAAPVVNSTPLDSLKSNVQKAKSECQQGIDKLIPGKEKTEHLPDDPQQLFSILKVYIDSGYNDSIYKLNSHIASDLKEPEKLKNYLDEQAKSDQCYPFVEQEILLKILDYVTEEQRNPSEIGEYRKVILEYLDMATNSPQSLFHLASYINIFQVLAENNIIENHFFYEAERLKNDVMGTVKQTDDEIIRALRENEMSSFVEVHQRRFETTSKVKGEFNQLIKEQISLYQ